MEKIRNIFYNLEANDTPDAIESPAILFYQDSNNASFEVEGLHKHSFTELFYFCEGEGFMNLENHTIPIKKGDLFIINANVLHAEYGGKMNKYLKYKLIAIANTFPFFNKDIVFQDHQLKFSFGNNNNIINRIFQSIFLEFLNKKSYFSLNVSALLTQLFVEIDRLFDISPAQNKSDKISKVKEFIDNNYALDLCLNDFTSIAFMSRTNLLNSFYKAYNKTPIHYLIEKRIEISKNLLKNTKSSIKEIAITVGFSNPTYFSETFKKLTGETPTSFRKINHYPL